MTELINPRLVNRVERSLRKRLNSEVRPHLLRAAAHSQTEDEFMAAAARLLLNPQERQRWLASWAVRRQHYGNDTPPEVIDSADTSPGGFDALTTTPGAFDTLPSTTPMPRVLRITPEQRELMREALSQELGPVANIVLDNESQRAHSTSDLLQRLEGHLESEDQRYRFRQATQVFKLAPST